jgi:hypothetical protein
MIWIFGFLCSLAEVVIFITLCKRYIRGKECYVRQTELVKEGSRKGEIKGNWFFKNFCECTGYNSFLHWICRTPKIESTVESTENIAIRRALTQADYDASDERTLRTDSGQIYFDELAEKFRWNIFKTMRSKLPAASPTWMTTKYLRVENLRLWLIICRCGAITFFGEIQGVFIDLFSNIRSQNKTSMVKCSS